MLLLIGSGLTGDTLYAALALGLTSVVIILRDSRWSACCSIMTTALAAVVLYNAAAAINSFWFPLPGTRPDSATFHEYALNIAEQGDFVLGVDYVFFVNWLALVYKSLGTSYFLASMLSVCLLAVSLRLFLGVSEVLKVERPASWLFLVFAFSPSLVFLGTVPLREAYELVLLQAILFVAISSTWKYTNYRAIVIAALVILMGLLHKALIFAGVVIMGCTFVHIVYETDSAHRSKLVTKLALMLVSVVGGFVLLIVFNEYGRSLVLGLVDKDIFWSIWHYRTSVDNIGSPNSAYGVDFHYQPFGEALFSVVKVYTYYLFYPLIPTTEITLKVFYALGESWMRVICFSLIIFYAVRLPQFRGSANVWLLIATYLTVTFIWSLGTTNYGQAVRHHMLTNWMLLIAVATGWSMERRARFSVPHR